MTDAESHPANNCHQCGEPMTHYRPPERGSPGIGFCEIHGISYDRTCVGPGSIYADDVSGHGGDA